MTEFNGAVSEEDKILVISKIVSNRMKENGIRRQRYELSKQLEELHVDVALFSETHLKPHERFLFQINTFIERTAIRAEKAELLLQLEKASPQPCRPTTYCFSRSDRGLHAYW
jgi:hypothetical protein